ncbi:uncharacterized protein A1O9_06531 [Exophiala aquamarina CBS 119918]|uniref:Uncharacterized protein n=1 Tax=Exophiala aquamarina CBS 119918 TaxID=1182545 RepID=A0A072PSV7_9EURO|nr:uncharacterized protein A1O9_06531 [Exophiala aquamarina CBS 119918]KEF58605.1 hypothetical protein A1O9_06531 [Exophiala aquamarina CBS 119918]
MILEHFEAGGERLLGSFRELWDILIEITAEKTPEVDRAKGQQPREILCILDALDECEEKGLRQLAEAFRKLDRTHKSNVVLKFLLSSRPHIHIQRACTSLGNTVPTIHLSGEDETEVKKISQEINTVIKFRVRELSTRLDLLPEEQQTLKDELTSVPNRTYLWVHLVFEIIQESIDISQESLRAQVRKLPETVEAAYDKILCRSRDPTKAKRLLHIVVAAERPLSLEEMALALAIRENHQSFNDLKLEPLSRFRNTVREICGLLVVIIDSKIYLLHQTAKEFLVKTETCNRGDSLSREVDSLRWRHSLLPADSHRVLAEICMWRLLWTNDKLDTADCYRYRNKFLDSHIMLVYCVQNRASHFRKAHLENSTATVSLAFRLCSDVVDPAFWFMVDETPVSDRYVPRAQHFDCLLVASYFGVESVVKLFLETDTGVKSQERILGRTALWWAAYWAVENGHEAALKLLIDTGELDINTKDARGRTLLAQAASSGYDPIVKLLLDVGSAHVDAQDEGGTTALSFAAACGYESIVKLLHSTGQVDLESKDKKGRTPLIDATLAGQSAIVMWLLKTCNVDANARNTALSYAASYGRRDVAKGLLNTGKINADSSDDFGRTALSNAAGNGNKAVVKVLLTDGKVDPQSRDREGYTPLWYATHPEVTSKERGDVAELLRSKHSDDSVSQV